MVLFIVYLFIFIYNKCAYVVEINENSEKEDILFMSEFAHSSIKIYALGGLGEVGKNTYCVESLNEIGRASCRERV